MRHAVGQLRLHLLLLVLKRLELLLLLLEQLILLTLKLELVSLLLAHHLDRGGVVEAHVCVSGERGFQVLLVLLGSQRRVELDLGGDDSGHPSHRLVCGLLLLLSLGRPIHQSRGRGRSKNSRACLGVSTSHHIDQGPDELVLLGDRFLERLNLVCGSLVVEGEALEAEGHFLLGSLHGVDLILHGLLVRGI